MRRCTVCDSYYPNPRCPACQPEIEDETEEEPETMKQTHRTFYYIFVRPYGSRIWTQHIKETENGFVPFVATTPEDADYEVVRIVESSETYCARVVPIDHPDEIDTAQYAQMAAGDTRYFTGNYQ